MDFNYIGLVSALATFFSIWWGHVAVRKLEANLRRLWPPMLVCIILSMVCVMIAVQTTSQHLSAAFGIIGVVFMWDAFEFYRQQKRVVKGHAPANPDNPRHAKLLVKDKDASTIDWLDREPRGYPYTRDELATIAGEGR